MTGADKPDVVAIVGPTASGKTGLAVRLAERLGGEVVNVDSMQVFRGLDVGTDKPTTLMRAKVPFHLVDVWDPGDTVDAASFVSAADTAIAGIIDRSHLPIAAGGTGLYHRALQFGLVDSPSRDDAVRESLRAWRDRDGIEACYAALQNIDPITAARVHPNDWVRIERALEVHRLTGERISDVQASHGFAEPRCRMLILGCFKPRDELYRGIEARLDQMWRGGLLDETRDLLARGLPLEHLPLKALGYRHAADFLQGRLAEEEALQLAKRDTRRFARRQLSWFRRVEAVQWLRMPLDDDDFGTVVRAVEAFREGAPCSALELPVVVDV